MSGIFTILMFLLKIVIRMLGKVKAMNAVVVDIFLKPALSLVLYAGKVSNIRTQSIINAHVSVTSLKTYSYLTVIIFSK